jgi:hypothetical protein
LSIEVGDGSMCCHQQKLAVLKIHSHGRSWSREREAHMLLHLAIQVVVL